MSIAVQTQLRGRHTKTMLQQHATTPLHCPRLSFLHRAAPLLSVTIGRSC